MVGVTAAQSRVLGDMIRGALYMRLSEGSCGSWSLQHLQDPSLHHVSGSRIGVRRVTFECLEREGLLVHVGTVFQRDSAGAVRWKFQLYKVKR